MVSFLGEWIDYTRLVLCEYNLNVNTPKLYSMSVLLSTFSYINFTHTVCEWMTLRMEFATGFHPYIAAQSGK